MYSRKITILKAVECGNHYILGLNSYVYGILL